MRKMSSRKDVFALYVRMKIENLRLYGEILEESLSEQLKRFISDVEDKASKLSEEVREDFYEYHSDDHWRLSEVFPNTLRASLFVTCFSLLEYELVRLCQHISATGNSLVPTKFENFELNESTFNRVKNYLKKNGGTFHKGVLWAKIREYQKLRNSIVHNGGRLNILNRVRLAEDSKESEKKLSEKQKSVFEKQKEIERIINSTTPLMLDGMNNIQFSEDFCPEVVDTIERFFKELYEDLPNRLFLKTAR